jgi:serine/threonine-protein kinase HipA
MLIASSSVSPINPRTSCKEADEVLEELIALNGSSTGARPKAMIGFHPETEDMVHGVDALPPGYEAWLVKFPNTQDGKDAGAIEYVYAQIAQAAGVAMTETHLIKTAKGGAYFATKRSRLRDPDRPYPRHHQRCP